MYTHAFLGEFFEREFSSELDAREPRSLNRNAAGTNRNYDTNLRAQPREIRAVTNSEMNLQVAKTRDNDKIALPPSSTQRKNEGGRTGVPKK